MQSGIFRFDQPFKPEQIGTFLSDFFGDPSVQQAVPVSAGPGSWGSLGPVAQNGVSFKRLRSTVLRLDFFDRLNERGLVRAGHIGGCLDQQVGDILVSDRLRLMLLDESAEEWDVFTPGEREELIFHVLRRLAVGGGMNQHEHEMGPYLDLTKVLYKDLVTVQKSAAGQLQIASLPVEVTAVAGCQLFPRDGPHNFCYLSVDPVARQVKYWYAAWFPMM